jgi:mono/diheme cytochrome c family protein
MRRFPLSILIVLLAAFTSGLIRVSAAQQAPRTMPVAPAPSHSPSEQRALLDQYCVTCHNSRLKTAGLALDNVDVTQPPAAAAIWEKVIRKVGTDQMPPPGRPRPDKPHKEALVSWLVTAIDRDAAAHPNPGRTESVHRLNRAEYRNAVRDLLALDLDVSELLPADDMSYGFDNMAGVLRITPSLLDRYVSAARKISRNAIGDPAIATTAQTFRLKSDLSQDLAFEDLPLGTRGGVSIPYEFPLDAEYSFKVEPLGGGAESQQLEVAVDGARVRVFELNARSGLGVGQGYDSEGEAYEVRVPVKAGPHVVAVSFVRKSAALVESVRDPFFAPHAEGAPRTQPAVGSVTITGPFNPSGVSLTPSRERIFVCHPANAGADAACARQILSTLARRAYRRPVTDAEVGVLLKFYQDGRAGGGFDGGIEMAIRRLLVSPEFLFRIESDPAGVAPATAYAVSDLDLASRLSFFLWSSIPDDQLLDAAVRGTLRKPGVLEQQVRRMLTDPRSNALVENFAGQWLQLRTIEGSAPNEFLFPNFGENLRRDFRRETELFFDSILRENRSVLDFITADYTFVNERLAKHYGFPNVYGSQFRRVHIPDENRRGLLGQGSFLTLTSLADRTTVVGRGKWILDNVVGSPPPSPPPPCPLPPGQTGVCVPAFPENKSGERVLTVRERMEQHRANPVCASCHARMDPLGFSLENYDATGQWRTRDGDTKVDASAVLPDGTKFEGPAGLRAWILARPSQFSTALTEKLMIYALGRGLESYDAPAIRKIVTGAANDYRFQSLIVGVVKSTPFQMRKSAPTAEAPAASIAAVRR